MAGTRNARATVLMATLILGLIHGPATAAADEEQAGPRVSVDQNGLQIESADGAFKAKLGGRLHADATFHVGDTPGPDPVTGARRNPTDGTEVRRARLITQITGYDDWHWTGEIDFANNDAAVKDFMLGYTGLDGLALTVGHQKQPYSLAVEMSSNDLPFAERGVDNGLILSVIDRAIGGRADAHGAHWFVAGGFYGDSVEPGEANAAEGWGTAAKAVWTPILNESRVLHLGFRGALRRPGGSNDSIRFRAETTNMSDFNVVDTGNIRNVNEVFLYGPEAAAAFGPFSIFGEYNRAVLRGNGFDTAQLESGHVGATWSLTGESRAAAYTLGSGEFKRLTPKRNFSLRNGGIGAWELAARYAYINLSDGHPGDGNPLLEAIRGGKQYAFTAAINWYVNPVVRFIFDWTHIIETGASSSEVNREAAGLNNFILRTQVNF